ncbi:AraC family transcriptional regulator [Acerihabitans sp. KWT182]|uniref:AraC family transcriptional regulator n=1 Tax=Acerihabitans sp. KWT182 TaxID=3157919 RepID=A0AAU7QA01_9GAMM
MTKRQWVNIVKDKDSQIETIRAHFEGHAYDAHWHDNYLVGVTESGVQQFHAGRVRYRSTPGKVITLAPGEVHDGDAVDPAGFTYRMLYIPPELFQCALPEIFDNAPGRMEISCPATLFHDEVLAAATLSAFDALHGQDFKIVKDHAMQQLISVLTRRYPWRKHAMPANERNPAIQRVRDFLHDRSGGDIGLAELAAIAGVDRFRLNRQFQRCYGLPPHAYLVQLRLANARRLLARGILPADAAAQSGFADQSHLGRWFKRAYCLTPAAYRRICTIDTDR